MMVPLILNKLLTTLWVRWGIILLLLLALALTTGGASFVFASTPDCPSVPAPQLISPENGAEVRYTAQDPYYRLIWEPVPDVPGYHLRVWDADTEALVVDEQIIVAGSDWYEIWSMEGSFTWNLISLNPVCGCPPSQPSETWAFTAMQNPPPAVPLNVRATDGTYHDRIIVTWEQPESESELEQWQVRRATQPNPQISVEVAATGIDTYIDKNVTPGLIYYYWVEACSHADGCSDLSALDTGYAELPPATPVNVRATDGQFTDRIEIDWDLPTTGPSIDHWLVYRSTQPDKEYAVAVDHSTNTHSISYDVIPGVAYYFWVQACTQADNCSELSEPDSGFAGHPQPPEAPVQVEATDGLYPNLIEINWEQPDNEADIGYWLVYRSQLPDVETSVVVDRSSNTRSLSEDVIPGVVYYYWIQACSSSEMCSERSEPDSGFAGGSPVVLDSPIYLPFIMR